MHEMEAKGWVCIRSAGSHGPVDVACLKNGMVMLFQVKKKGQYVTREEKEKMQEFSDRAGYSIMVRMI